MATLLPAGSLGTTLARSGMLLFAATALFALVTLQVELDASRRGKEHPVSRPQGIISRKKCKRVSTVPDAYAAAQAITPLFHFVTNKGTSINCRERAEDKADGAQKPESRQVGMRISSTDQRSIPVAQQINRGALNRRHTYTAVSI